MLDEPSAFWRELGDEQARILAQTGVENVKRTLAHRYFTWRQGLRSDQLWAVAGKTRMRDWPRAFRDFPPPDEMGRRQWFFQVVFTRLLWLYAKRIDRLHLIRRLREPAFGNPYRITLGGSLISQDLANSVIELYAMLDEFDFAKPLRVLEIGAGYGRNAYVFLSLFPRCEYTIVDIPPAIDVARAYLGEVCGTERVAFLSPSEATTLPDNSFDLALNISSFHEMTPAQVERYFALIDRACRKLYLKQWKRWHNPADDVTMTEAGYPYRPHWKRIYSRTAIQPAFFEAVYLTHH